MKIHIIPRLELYKISGNGVQTYNDDFYIAYYNHFPFLVNDDDTLWKHANLYLLSKLKTPTPPHYSTLYGIAKELKSFYQWCVNHNVDYINEKRRVRRPTYMYRFYLQQKLEQGINSPSTIKKKMSAIINFYEYLQNVEKLSFPFPLWEKQDALISYKDAYGFLHGKKIESKDLLRTPSVYYEDERYIQDGGRLKPLMQEEQILVFKALDKVGNTEMTLACLIAVTTGARIQTVCTLRLKHFQKEINANESCVLIKVGLGTEVDTKNNTIYTLQMPVWVYKKIQLYLKTERYIKKFKNQKHIFEDDKNQYIFLTNRGTPYYVSKYDQYLESYTHTIPTGNNIRQFLDKTLQKELEYKFKFKFHDLRATFAMNL